MGNHGAAASFFFFFFSAELKRRGFGGMSGKKKLALMDTG